MGLFIGFQLLIGANNSIYVEGTNAFFLERSSLSSLPFALDDPPKSAKGSDLSEIVVDLYNGCKTVNLKALFNPCLHHLWLLTTVFRKKKGILNPGRFEVLIFVYTDSLLEQ